MALIFRTSRRGLVLVSLACLVVSFATSPVQAQDTASHRVLRGRTDQRQAQLRLELMQYLLEHMQRRSAAGQPAFEPDSLDPEVKDQLRKVGEQIIEPQTTPDPAETRSAPQTTPETRRPAPGSTTTQGSESKPGETVIQRLLRRITGQPNDELQPSELPTVRPGQAPAPLPRDRASNRPPNSPVDRDQIDRFVKEWEKQLKRGTANDPTALPAPQSASTGGSTTETQPTTSGPRGSGASARPPAPPIDKEFWKDLARQSREEGSRPRPAGATDSRDSHESGSSLLSGGGFFDEAMRRTAEGMSEHIAEILKNSRKRKSKRPRKSSAPGFFKRVSQANARTRDFFRRQMGSSSSNSVSMPSARDAGSLLLPLLVLGLAGAGFFYWLRRRENEALMPGGRASFAPVPMPADISSRDDVITAFHSLASRTPEVRGSWWTHSRVGRALRKLMPSRDSSVRDLTEAYEAARYLPPDQPLTAEQLEAAREAIKRCANS